MKFIIDTSCELSPDLQWYFYLIKENRLEEANQFETENSPFVGNPVETYTDKLIRLGYLVTRNIPNKLKKTNNSTIDILIEVLIEPYLAKFKNKKTGVAGDRPKVIKKFHAFFLEHPEYADSELILSATTRYMNTCARDNFKYVAKAHYFIYKDDKDGFGSSSQLANYCEEVKNLGGIQTLPTFSTDKYDVG